MQRLLMLAYRTIGNLLLLSVPLPLEYFSPAFLLATIRIACTTSNIFLCRQAILIIYCFSSFLEFADVLLVSGMHQALVEAAMRSLVQLEDSASEHRLNPCFNLIGCILNHSSSRATPATMTESMLQCGKVRLNFILTFFLNFLEIFSAFT